MTRQALTCAIAAALVLGVVPVSFSQTPPDFAGTWVVESVDAPRMQDSGGARGGGRGGGRFGGGGGIRGGRAGGGAEQGGMFAQPFRKGDRVTITQTRDELVVVDEASGRRSSYSLDGRETSSPGPAGASVKSTTRWEGVALVTESSQSMSTPRGDSTIKTRQIRSLNEDGRTMSLVTSTETPAGSRRTTVTFTREAAR